MMQLPALSSFSSRLAPSGFRISLLLPRALASSSSSSSSSSSTILCARRFSTSALQDGLDKLVTNKGGALEGLLAQCYGVSSWYKAPEFGVESWELLSRASAFLLPLPPSPLSEDEARIAVVTSAHIVHPFSFPKYYPEERFPWLHLLTPEHVRTKFEVRDSAGALQLSLPLRRKVWAHSSLDVALALPKSSAALLQQIEETSRAPVLTSLSLSPLPLLSLQDQHPLHAHFVGHTLIPDSPDQDQVPTVVSGVVLGGTGQGRAFARTFAPSSSPSASPLPKPLEMGMCGGPVLDSKGQCVGAVEGIVSSGPPLLQGSAVIITADHIKAFVDETEPELH